MSERQHLYRKHFVHACACVLQVFQRHWRLHTQSPSTLSQQNYHRCRAVLPFSKLNKIFFGYFDPENIFLGSENKYFSGWPNRYVSWKTTGGHWSIAGRAEAVIVDHTLRLDLTPSDLADLAWAFANLLSGSLLLRRRPALSLQKRHPIAVRSAHESSYELWTLPTCAQAADATAHIARCVESGASVFTSKQDVFPDTLIQKSFFLGSHNK